MVRIALEAFEEQTDGEWVCTRNTEVKGALSNMPPVHVEAGRRFPAKSTFAGHNDFPAYLGSVAVEARRP